MDWFRSHHGAPTDPKWRVIAKNAGVRFGDVAAIVWALLDYASQNEDRGSIAGFDVETLAVTFDYDETQIVAVIDALRHKGVLEEFRFAQWEKRQPKREDSSAERVRAHRKRAVTQRNAPDKIRLDTEKKEEPDGSSNAHARASGTSPRQQTMSAEARQADAEFETWYGGYPHKVGKGAARIAYRKARLKASAATLVIGRDGYIRSKPPDRDWCNPATWLNQERWEDVPDERRAEVVDFTKPTEADKRAAILGPLAAAVMARRVASGGAGSG